MTLSADRIRELLDYDVDTGVFRWRKGRQGIKAAGAVAGDATWNGYWRVCVDGRRYMAHVLAWLYMTGEHPAADIDHINGVRTDNRFGNLRVASRSENNQNQRRAHRDNKSGYLGVSPNRGGWAASININKRKHHIGTFDTPEQAHKAYLEAKREIHPAGTI